MFCVLALTSFVAVHLQDAVMTKSCAVAGCDTNKKKKINGVNIITNPGTVFIFPDETKKKDLYDKWVRFCNQKHAFKTRTIMVYANAISMRSLKRRVRRMMRGTPCNGN